jgi:hypothetical protein
MRKARLSATADLVLPIQVPAESKRLLQAERSWASGEVVAVGRVLQQCREL